MCATCRDAGLMATQGASSEIDPGDPFQAAKEIGLTIRQADVDWFERRTLQAREAVTETLWCEAGGHEWTLRRMPGKRPRSCPDHADSVQAPRDWAGDLANCFLIDGAWAVRLYVDAPLLRGATWRIPGPVAKGIGVEDARSLAPRSGPTIALIVRRRGTGFAGESLAESLIRANVAEGDFVFVRLSARNYELVGRRRREVLMGDGLGRLLWGCGIDPSDRDARSRPWDSVARAIGGTEPTRENVRQRLVERGNFDLVTALEEARVIRSVVDEDPAWPEGWFFTTPLASDPSQFALDNGNGRIRVAIGVSDGPSNGSALVDPTGISWKELSSVELLRLPPPEMHEQWIRWKRAEHHAVRSSLTGSTWQLEFDGSAWTLDQGETFVDLADALGSVPTNLDRQPIPPATSAQAACPRSGFAYGRLIKRALSQGLRRIESAADVGLRATFESGEYVDAPTLADLLGDPR